MVGHNRNKPMRLGVDLGGTKIEAIMIDQEGLELFRHRIAAPQNDYKNTLQAIEALVKETEKASSSRTSATEKIPLGVGIPGTISPITGLVKNANSTWLIGHHLDKDLAEMLDRPVKIANDANCFVLSESYDGSAKAATTVFGVILGTGVGGGLVVKGSVIEGPNSIAGEWGHNPLPWPNQAESRSESPGPPCYCGLNGCTETFLSGKGLQHSYQECARSDLPWLPSAMEIAGQATNGDTIAIASLDLYCSRLARALASVINIIDPDVIVLGGGLSNISQLYAKVPELWTQWIFSDHVETRLVKNKHGDSSGVRGAAYLWPSKGQR